MKGKQAGHIKTKISKYVMNIIIYKATLSKETKKKCVYIYVCMYVYTVKYNTVTGIKKKKKALGVINITRHSTPN